MKLQQREEFLTFTGGFLLVLLLITIGLAAWAGLSPLRAIHFTFADLGIGIVAALGMMLIFSGVSSARQQAEEILGPPLANCRWYDLIVLAIFVGVIEELLFRGVLEPWVAKIDPWAAFWGVNLLFGLLHSVTWVYALVAAILGMLLSLLAHHPGEFNLLRPIVAHAVYDYIGFVWIATNFRRRPEKSPPANHPSEGETHVD